MPGLRNSNRLHSSPRWFSTGVPLSASRCCAAQQPRRLGGRRGGILDGLRFVQHHVIELDFGQAAARRAAACRRWSAPGRARGSLASVARRAGVFQHAQLRREARRFLAPVEHQRFRHHHQRRPFAPPPAGLPAAPAPAPSCPRPCRPPGSRRSRTRAGTPSSPGLRAGSRAVGPRNRPAAPPRCTPWKLRSRSRTRSNTSSHAHFRLRRQQRIQQPRLVRCGSAGDPRRFAGAQPGQRREARQPLLRQQPEGAVAQPHHGVAAAQRRQQLRQAGARCRRNPLRRAVRTSRCRNCTSTRVCARAGGMSCLPPPRASPPVSARAPPAAGFGAQTASSSRSPRASSRLPAAHSAPGFPLPCRAQCRPALRPTTGPGWPPLPPRIRARNRTAARLRNASRSSRAFP